MLNWELEWFDEHAKKVVDASSLEIGNFTTPKDRTVFPWKYLDCVIFFVAILKQNVQEQ